LTSGASSVRINLPAGTYVLTPVGPSSGGEFTATEFCTCNVSPRKYAFIYDFVTSEQSARVRVSATDGSMDSGMNYSTSEAALAGAPVQRITLTQSGWISLFIYDTPISDNAGGVSLRITKESAAGTAVISLTPTSLSFSQTLNTTSAARSVTVSNTGNAALTISGVTVAGSDASQFAQTNNCSSVAAGNSCTINVTFRPTSAGSKSAQISIAHNASGSPTTISLSGEGVELGSSALSAAVSAQELLRARPGLASGVYWFDPDGEGGNQPFRTYADLTTNGGGWIQVRRIPGTGAWYSGNDDLRGTSPDNVDRAATFNANSQWSLRFDYFVDAATEYMFATGDGSAWCVLQRGNSNFNGITASAFDLATQRILTTRVLGSSGVGVQAGGLTNVLSRSNAEDPWIGCEGGHDVNQAKMLYGEAGFPGYVTFKNSRNGINVFVRGRAALSSNALAISESQPFGGMSIPQTPAISTKRPIAKNAPGTATSTSEPNLTLASTASSGMSNDVVVSETKDEMVGSRYRIGRSLTKANSALQIWTLDYRSSDGQRFASHALPRTSGVIWRRTGADIAMEFATTAWVRMCSDRVWTVQDGCQLLTHAFDRSLARSRMTETSINSESAEVTLVDNIGCTTTGDLWVEGYAFGVSANEPSIGSDLVAAKNFRVTLDGNGAAEMQSSRLVPFNVAEFCKVPAKEKELFCSQAQAVIVGR
jgi:hypothetical protein